MKSKNYVLLILLISFFIMVDVNWLDASDMMFFDAHDVFWCFLTFFDVYWRFLKFQKISKNFWRKLTKIDISVNLKPRQLTSIDINWRQLSSAKVIWRQLTTIDVKWLQTWCFLTPFDVFWFILTIFDNKNFNFF